MSAGRKKDGDYYPLRWKFADRVENIVILYRTRAAVVIAALGLLLILAGIFIIGWRPFESDDDATNQDQTEIVDGADDAPTQEESIGVAANGQGSATQNGDLVTGQTRRPIATDAQLRSATSGVVIELGAAVMNLTGGFSSDEAADAAFMRATMLFPTREVLDSQLLSDEFVPTDDVLIRIVDPLFAEDTAELDPALVPLITDVATAIGSSGELTVEVVAHVPRLLLSQDRAQVIADQLVADGIASNIITVTGRGNTEPLPGIPSRVEFILR